MNKEQFDLVAEIHASGDGKNYDRLVKSEPKINWLGFVAKIYKESHSMPSVTTYIRGICKFKEYLLTLPNAPSLTDTVDQMKQDEDAIYRIFDEFTSWCDSVKNYKPATTWVHTQSIKKLLVSYLNVKIDDQTFENRVTMPKNRPLREEYPPNEIIRKIIDASSPRLRVFEQVVLDTGFEPIDAAQLKVSYFKFNEDPVRILIEREKTSEPITAFINAQTAAGVKMIIANEKKGPDDFIFTEQFTHYTVESIRSLYNKAVKRAGLNEKISGHKFGKYHLKIYKKRWFTLAISAGVPEYVVQGMLGRKKYLDQYNALRLEDKQAFAKKILKVVSIYADKIDRQEVIAKASEALGFAVDEKSLHELKQLLANWRMLPDADNARLLGGQ